MSGPRLKSVRTASWVQAPAVLDKYPVVLYYYVFLANLIALARGEHSPRDLLTEVPAVRIFIPFRKEREGTERK